MQAFLKYPDRFKGRILKAPELRKEIRINPSKFEKEVSQG